MVKYYKVGGCVRDELLGVRSKDIDYAVEASSYEEMRADLKAKGTFVWLERPEFFAIRGNHPKFGPVDFTLCRKEGFYSDSRHPDSVEIGTIYDDLSRRDFTVNAIARDEDELLIDPHLGVQDLKDMYLRCVGDTYERFNEDPLRIFRALRFKIVRGFILDYEIEAVFSDNIRHYEEGIRKLPVERIYEELRKCFTHSSRETFEFMSGAHELTEIMFDMGIKLQPTML